MERKAFGEELPDEPRSRDFDHKGANRVAPILLKSPAEHTLGVPPGGRECGPVVLGKW